MMLVFDDLTVVLAGTASILLLIHLVFLRLPPPITHPLLLGRQAEASKVRKPGQSVIWGAASNGGRALQRRTSASVTNLATLAIPSTSTSPIRANAFRLASALISALKVPTEPSNSFIVVVSISDSNDLLLTLLALSLLPVQVILVSSKYNNGPLGPFPPISAVITDRSQADVLGSLFQFSTSVIYTSKDTETDPPSLQELKQLNQDVQDPSSLIKPAQFNLDDVFLRYVYKNSEQEKKSPLEVVDVTHANFSAACVSFIYLFPSAVRLCPEDRVLFVLDLNDSLGNISVVLTSLHLNAQFRIISPSNDDFEAVSKEFNPTVLFIAPNVFNAFVNNKIKPVISSKSFSSWALAYKRRLLYNGNVSYSTLADSMFFNTLRSPFPKLRVMCVLGAQNLSQDSLVLARCTLGIPILSTLIHPTISTGPILSTQYYDFQIFPGEEKKAHSGCPVFNGEIRLIDIPDDDAINDGQDPVGKLLFHAPSVTTSKDSGSHLPTPMFEKKETSIPSIDEMLSVNEDPLGEKKPWQDTNWIAKVKANGTAIVDIS